MQERRDGFYASISMSNLSLGKDRQPRLVFVVNHVAFFVSHRLPLAQEAVRRGWSVHLITGQPASRTMEGPAVEALHSSGIGHTRLGFSGSLRNPLREMFGLFRLWLKLLQFSPDIVHCASPVGLLYGGIAARFAAVPGLVLAVSGMGYAFTDTGERSLKRNLVKGAYRRMVRLAYGHRNCRVIVQNLEDQRWVAEQGLSIPERVSLVPGSGVDLVSFGSVPISGRQSLVVLPARMLKDKGVCEFVGAARIIRSVEPSWRFVLAGTADYRNPSAVDPEAIGGWVSEGLVEWLGHVPDMPALLSNVSIVCLPSYREGMPKALLEAAAAGCAVVTTDVTGCREAIIPGVTGDLVPVRDVNSLADALLSLIRDKARRETYGAAGRELARQRFGVDSIVECVFGVYRLLLDAGHGLKSREALD